MTEEGGPAWRQTIFHPFAQASAFGRGNVLRANVLTEGYAISAHPQLDYLLATVLHDPETGRITIFALNRHDTETMDLSMDLRGFWTLKIASARELHHSDLKVANTREAPESVKPAKLEGVSLSNGGLHATLKPLSWNVIALSA